MECPSAFSNRRTRESAFNLPLLLLQTKNPPQRTGPEFPG
jgi:hypothetical protein